MELTFSYVLRLMCCHSGENRSGRELIKNQEDSKNNKKSVGFHVGRQMQIEKSFKL